MVLPQVSKSENLQEVGRKIRHYREKKKMSQLELAEAIGVTQNTIYLIETAQSEMKLEKLFRIAEVLDVTPNKLLPGEAKTASNKFFEFEHMMKQLSEADQELIFNMVMPCMKRLLPNTEYSRAMKSHFRKFGNQMSGSGNHLCNYASLLA